MNSTLTTSQVETMMHDIDVRLNRKSHYDKCPGLYNLSYHVGDHEYVSLEDFSDTFDEYGTDHNGAEWACYIYILAKNHPEYTDFFIKAYNLGGLDVLKNVVDKQTEDHDTPVVYLVSGK